MGQLIAGEIDLAFAPELADGQSVVPMEFASDVDGVHADFARNLSQPQRFLETDAQEFVNVPEPARGVGFPLCAHASAKLSGDLARQPLNRERSHIVHLLPLLV